MRFTASTRRSRTRSCPTWSAGTIRLIGATTENPSFEIISALLSRCRVYVLEPLSEERIAALLRRALEDKERGLGALNLTADDDALELIASYSSGDCRSAYNTLEVARSWRNSQTGRKRLHHIRPSLRVEAVQQRVLMYDKSGEEHYNLISALHKSVRNSDPDAALYWLARMFAAGEDPLYLARRVVRMAVEDIGLAAPEALNLCLSAKQAMEFLGSPEGDLALAEAVVYLALAPKSNSVYTAWGAVQARSSTPARSPSRCTCATRRRA
jgi:putative ATPase